MYSLGILDHIQSRVKAHTKKLISLLPAGLARIQIANIDASNRVDSIYALSVLLSGVAPLNLLEQEIAIPHANHKKTLLYFQKLPRNTPDVFDMFFAGFLGV